MHHGFQAIVGTLFLVDAVQMISQRGQRDTQVAGDLGKVFGFREQAKDSLLLFGEWRDGWSATATISLEISSILASNSSLFLRCEMSRARCTIRRRSRRGSSNTRVETFTRSLLPERVLTSRSKIGSGQLLRSALLDAAIADTDLRSQA